MKPRALWAGLILVVALPAFAERKFTAASTDASIKGSGQILITNEGSSLVAYQFHGNIRTALVRVRSSRQLMMNPYGPILYDSDAEVRGGVPPEIAGIIREASKEHGLDPRLVAAVAWRESAFDTGVVSHRGASGIMQLMPETAKLMGVSDVFDARQNIFGGTRYLRLLLDAFRGDLELALAAYNAGPGAVEKYQGIPPYRETIQYVKKVRGDYEQSVRLSS
ncbi:MAG TPA: lytic transglycosylase domain-containing protein [Thermoanaerobaculia bacterium]|nr:lytic transglycosylase domain-containing protein [Thermoanaerobaculia bacterium]